MQKIAIFVEGQTEQIVLRELILRKFEYVVAIDCRTLFSDGKYGTAPYDYKNPDATVYYQIINVGNDNAVLSRILKREQLLWSEGFEKIVALRDMYSKAYRDSSATICDEVTNKFKSGILDTINTRAIKPDKIIFCHAIMETEAWFLGLPDNFAVLDCCLTPEYINENLEVDLVAIDPEKTIYHPASVMCCIYDLIGKNYDKSRGDIEAIASRIEMDSYMELYNSDKCNSFNIIYDNL